MEILFAKLHFLQLVHVLKSSGFALLIMTICILTTTTTATCNSNFGKIAVQNNSVILVQGDLIGRNFNLEEKRKSNGKWQPVPKKLHK